MSIVDETLGDVLIGSIPKQVVLYEQLIQAAEALFDLDAKNLEGSCKTHAKDLMFYNVMLQECKTIEDTISMKLDELEGQLYKQYNEGQNLKLGLTEIKQYIKGDQRYVKAMEILLEVRHVKRRLEAIVDALKSMGWSLNNIVKLRVAQLEDVTL